MMRLTVSVTGHISVSKRMKVKSSTVDDLRTHGLLNRIDSRPVSYFI